MIIFQFTENPDKKPLNEENLKMHDKLYLKEVHCEPVNDRKYKYTKEKEEHNLVWIRNVNTCYAQYQMEMIQALTQSDLHEFPKSDLKELKVNPPARYIKSDEVFKNGPSKIGGRLHSINFTFRSSRQKVFCKRSALGNFAKFTGKHLCQNLFFNKAAGLRKSFKNTFFNKTAPVAASVLCLFMNTSAQIYFTLQYFARKIILFKIKCIRRLNFVWSVCFCV